MQTTKVVITRAVLGLGAFVAIIFFAHRWEATVHPAEMLEAAPGIEIGVGPSEDVDFVTSVVGSALDACKNTLIENGVARADARPYGRALKRDYCIHSRVREMLGDRYRDVRIKLDNDAIGDESDEDIARLCNSWVVQRIGPPPPSGSAIWFAYDEWHASATQYCTKLESRN